MEYLDWVHGTPIRGLVNLCVFLFLLVDPSWGCIIRLSVTPTNQNKARDKMIYSQSIYCKKTEQEKPRPANWQSTKSNGIEKLYKYSWVKPPAVAFEISFISAHTPLHDDWKSENSKLKLKYNSYVFPFGTMSRRSDNTLYWRNCAITCLVKYNVSYIELAGFNKLIDELGKDEPVPSHWVKIINKAKKTMQEEKEKFKACRQHEKENFGLIPQNKIPKNIEKDLVAISRLKLFLNHAPHNRELITSYIEKFLADSFTNLIKYHLIDADELGDLSKKSHDLQLDLLAAFIKERVMIIKHDIIDNILLSSFVNDTSIATEYHLGVTSRDYGSLNQLVNLAGELKEYDDMPDVSKWFNAA
jgi:hypothetical protein